jgi:hypothetical protein
MGSFDYNDDYSVFNNLLERSNYLTEARASKIGGAHPSFPGLAGRLQKEVGKGFPRDVRMFITEVLYNLDIFTDEDIDHLRSVGGAAGSAYRSALEELLDAHGEEIKKRSDEIGDAIEDRFQSLVNINVTRMGETKVALKKAELEATKAAKAVQREIRGGKDLDDSVSDNQEKLFANVAVYTTLTNSQGMVPDKALDTVEKYAVEFVNSFNDLDVLIRKLKTFDNEDFNILADELSNSLSSVKGRVGISQDDEDPYRGVNDPGDSENSYEGGLAGQDISEIEDEEDIISRESLNNNMRKRKLLFEKKKNWMKGAVKKPGALNAAAKAAGESKSEYCASPPSGKAEKRCNLWKTFNKHRPEDEEDTEKERRYEDRWGKDLDREREREGSSSAGEYSDVDKDDFCGPAGGAAPGTYPVNSEKRARAALSYAHNAPDPEGIKRCVYKKAKEHGWFDEEDEEFRYSPMLDSHKTNTSGYLTEQIAKDKRNKIKPRAENQSFKERFKPKTHWQLQELRRRGL